tara:strand:- start:241 stop:639 length:399 start_codon:yes stop_codon:yes gene_type:complete
METKMDTLNKFKGVVSLMNNAVNEAGGLPVLSVENCNRNKPALRHVAQPETKQEAIEFLIEKKREDKLASAEGITTFDSHATDGHLMQYIETPNLSKCNRILLDGRVINPKGKTIRYWKDELLQEGVESIEI